MLLTKERFVDKSIEIHGNLYNYSEASPKKLGDRVSIICKKHGLFTQYARLHMAGSQCPKCSLERSKTWTDDDDKIVIAHYQELGGAKKCATILSKTIPSVRARANRLGLSKPAWKYKIFPAKRWTSLLSAAKKRGYVVNITPDQIEEIFIKQNGKCALTGWPIVFSVNRKENTGSVDRIDSDKHYEIDNIQIVHKLVNRVKLDNSEEFFYKICKSVTSYKRKELDWPRISKIWTGDEYEQIEYNKPIRSFSPEELFDN
jgi:hypothetical protein